MEGTATKLTRSKFTPEEDSHLLKVVRRYGCKDWNEVARHMPGRSGRQCRERWCNYINPDLERLPWTPDDDALLREKIDQFGTQWQSIMTFFPRRSRNEIKNRWFVLRPKSVIQTGFIPVSPEPAEQDCWNPSFDAHDKEEPFWQGLGLDYL
jgi:hypothetical protein